MNQSIAIIELYQHDEVLRHYCELLRDSEYNIKVFCSKVVYDCLEYFWDVENFQWEVQKVEESIPSFLKKQQTALQSVNLVFITTILSDFKAFYKVVKVNKTIVLIHNAHSFFDPDGYLIYDKPIEDRLRRWKLFFHNAHLYKRRIIEASTALAFPTQRILRYAKEHFKLSDDYNLISLPFAYLKEERTIEKDEKITITIPGTISTELRDYEIVLKAFQKLEKILNEKIRLVFLGRSDKEEVSGFKSFSDLDNEKIELITFENFIPSEIYENWLLKTDFLILPLKEFGRNYIYREHLGYSKISGSINDMIRYGIPALIPHNYPLDETLEGLVDIIFIESELAERVESWINNKTYLEKAKYKKQLLTEFSFEKRRDSFLKEINSII